MSIMTIHLGKFSGKIGKSIFGGIKSVIKSAGEPARRLAGSKIKESQLQSMF